MLIATVFWLLVTLSVVTAIVVPTVTLVVAAVFL
jgi:hypothetical protein